MEITIPQRRRVKRALSQYCPGPHEDMHVKGKSPEEHAPSPIDSPPTNIAPVETTPVRTTRLPLGQYFPGPDEDMHIKVSPQKRESPPRPADNGKASQDQLHQAGHDEAPTLSSPPSNYLFCSIAQGHEKTSSYPLTPMPFLHKKGDFDADADDIFIVPERVPRRSRNVPSERSNPKLTK